MRVRYLAAAGLAAAAALGISVAASGASPTRGAAPAVAKAESITVWLQVDAQTSWPGAVDAATKAFQAKHPGVEVKVEYQQWSDHLTKLDAALAGGNAPDVVELGNSETTKYMDAGAFLDLSKYKGSFENSATWLKGLTTSCTYKGKLMCVPYYAGARGVIYRTDYYKAAGIKGTPKSLDEFVKAGTKLMNAHKNDKRFSALYFPGKYWYAGMSFVYDFGGQIAKFENGKWKGALDSPQAIAGLTKFKSVVTALSRADKNGDELKQDQFMAQGHAAAIIANGWEWGVVIDKKAGNPKLAKKLGAYPMPSRTKGKYMPTFLGGSDLAIPVTSKQSALALDWIRAFAGNSVQRQLATEGKVIPNTTSLLKINAANPQLAPFAEAAKFSWFVPTAPNWANVESGQVLQQLQRAILTGSKSVPAAAKEASGKITKILNASS